MFVHFRISAVCSCCLSDLFLMMYPSYYLSVHYLAEKKVCWRKGKIKRMCFIITLFQLFVIIFAVDWYLLVGKIGAWYLIPFLLCLLLFVSHSFFSTLIDICKEDKADSLVYLIKRNIWLLSKNVKGFLWYLCLLYGLFWCIQHDFYSLHYCIQGCHLSQYFA